SDVLHLTEVRAHAGLGTELDVERQREQLASTEASLPSLESAERESIYELSTLTAQAPTALV
ncbi:MAG: hypothetical protein JO319_07625, partial [Acidobacteriaceae bacterium]|nr:hypothetical protein [Acidobacteriaceae bacterium]